MVRAIANKRLDLSDEEYAYYLKLEKVFGSDIFRGMFDSDSDGKITAITPHPNQPTAMAVIFFLLNTMMNQRLRGIDDGLIRLSDLEERVAKIEKDLKNGE